MKIHEFKVWPEYYEPLIRCDKSCEIRKNDRDYAVGDVLYLREYSLYTGLYSGRSCLMHISHILDDSQGIIPAGYVAMSVKYLFSDDEYKAISCLTRIYRGDDPEYCVEMCHDFDKWKEAN